jgi:hypothetical protein
MTARRVLAVSGLAWGLASAHDVRAQNPAAAQPRPTLRRNIAVMSLASPAFGDGDTIPLRFSQPGRDVSPPLVWSGAPDSVASYVLLVHDVDAATGNGTDDVLHWLVWNIPGSAGSLSEGIPPLSQLPDGTRQISASGPYYRGPGAPAAGPPHHYLLELFALDMKLEVPAVGASPAATRAAVLAAMAGHVRGKAAMVARFRRSAP